MRKDCKIQPGQNGFRLLVRLLILMLSRLNNKQIRHGYRKNKATMW